MRILLAALVLATSITTASATDFDQLKTGREKRVYVISYIKQNNLVCKDDGTSIPEQEANLAKRSWTAVKFGLYAIYCSQAPQKVVLKK